MKRAPREAELEAEIIRLRDLLQREKLDAERSEQQIRFQARLLDAVHEAVIGTDPTGIVLYWNRFAEGLYGWTAEEALGRSILDLTPAENVLRDAEAALARLRRGEARSVKSAYADGMARALPAISAKHLYTTISVIWSRLLASHTTSASAKKPRRSRPYSSESFTTV